MIFHCDAMTASALYPLLAGTVVPRPIAWVSTVDEEGRSNLAPFSFFQLVTDSPPTLMLSVNRRADGSAKDTSRNVAATKQAVIHLVRPEQLEQMSASAAELPYGESEIESLQLATVRASQVLPPKLADALVSFECELVSHSPYPAHAPSCDLILLKVLCMDIDDSLLGDDGRILHQQVDWLARLGGLWYCHSQHADNIALARPSQAPRR